MIEEIMAIPKQGPVIAIDGPAGTGKSSATRRLADSLHYVHVDAHLEHSIGPSLF